MAIDPASAAAAYRANAARITKAVQDAAGMEAPDQTKSNFMDLVKSTVEGAITSNQNAENLSREAIAGRAELSDVVTSVAQAEVTLNTVVAIRDKVISAYQEIMRMPI